MNNNSELIDCPSRLIPLLVLDVKEAGRMEAAPHSVDQAAQLFVEKFLEYAQFNKNALNLKWLITINNNNAICIALLSLLHGLFDTWRNCSINLPMEN